MLSGIDEFIDLLTQTDMQSLERNHRLEELAEMVRKDPSLPASFIKAPDKSHFARQLNAFIERFGDLSSGVTGSRRPDGDLKPLIRLVAKPPRKKKARAAG